jgi:hypothetical protein
MDPFHIPDKGGGVFWHPERRSDIATLPNVRMRNFME